MEDLFSELHNDKNSDALERLKKDVENAAKKLLGKKLSRVVLFGSYARGDFDSESDIDFALLSTIANKSINLYNEKLGEISSELSIKYGVVISLMIISTETFNEYKDVLPFYMNLIEEGKVIYG